MKQISTDQLTIGNSTSIEEAKIVVSKHRLKIDNFECNLKYASRTIDWGNPEYRGLPGCCTPRGIKKYYCVDLSKYLHDTDEKAFTLLWKHEPRKYAIAREYGCNHMEALIYALAKEYEV